MRRSLSLVTLLLLMTPFIHLHGQTELRPRGDVNRDWKVSIDDVTDLITMMLNDVEYHALYTYDADINSDKTISIEDVTCLIEGLLGGELSPMPAYSGTLPVLFINTEDGKDIVSKEDYLQADWWLDAMGIDGYESIGSPDQPQGMQIKGRGNYTWKNYPKKSFRLKLDAKQPLMGMHSNKHYCLMGHPDDFRAFLKNTVGFELSRRIGMAYTPAQEPVEVVLNGQYIGLYFLTEKIRVDKHRVNIEEQDDGEMDAECITGGWLLEFDNNPTPGEYVSIVEKPGSTIWQDWITVTYHSPEKLSHEQKTYLKRFMQNANNAIYSTDKLSTEWERYIDIDTLAMYYIVGEIMDDLEYFAGSCYMYKHCGTSAMPSSVIPSMATMILTSLSLGNRRHSDLTGLKKLWPSRISGKLCVTIGGHSMEQVSTDWILTCIAMNLLRGFGLHISLTAIAGHSMTSIIRRINSRHLSTARLIGFSPNGEI